MAEGSAAQVDGEGADIEEVKQESASVPQASLDHATIVKDQFERALDMNKQELKKDKAGKFENNCASFLMASSIGIFCIEALSMIVNLNNMPMGEDSEND